MKTNQLSLTAYNLLNAATALAGILDTTVEKNQVIVNFADTAELIRDVQVTAKAAADELMYIHEYGKEVER